MHRTAYPGQKPKFLEAKKLEEFQVRLMPQLQVKIFGQRMSTYASALRAAEQIEQAHQAAGLTLESQSKTGYLSPSRSKESQSKGPFEPYNHFSDSQWPRTRNERTTNSSEIVTHNSPENRRTSTQVENTTRTRRSHDLSPETKNRTTSSTDTEVEEEFRNLTRRIKFKPSRIDRVVNTSHGKMYYDSKFGPPRQHEPNLSKQPLRSSIKPMDHHESRQNPFQTYAGHTPPAQREK